MPTAAALDPRSPTARFPGLAPAEVEASRRAGGHNVMTPPTREPWWRQWLGKFADPVIRILMVAAAIQIGVGALRGEYLEGIAIVLAILLATTLAFVNEFRAAREFDVLNQVNDDTPVKAIRAGQFLTLARRDLVAGDVVLIESGEEVPADGTVLDATALSVAEASLTGEAKPVRKRPAGATSEGEGDGKVHAYPTHQVLRGTMVADGNAVVRLDSVGDRTELGRLGRKATEETEHETPLNEQLARLSQGIGLVGLGIAGLTFAALVARDVMDGDITLSAGQGAVFAAAGLGLLVALARVWAKIGLEGLHAFGAKISVPEWLGRDTAGRWLQALGAGAVIAAVGIGGAVAAGLVPPDPAAWFPAGAVRAILNDFMIAVVIIVVAVPEGLAMSVTLSLAYSMRRMTAQNTLVRKMHATETIGAATVICSDKTGTLTQNKMQVLEAHLEGLGGAPLGAASPGTPGARVVEAIAVNSTAQLAREDGHLKPLGNPTEGALLVWLDAQAVNYQAERSAFRVAAQLPFSTERKFMATLGADRAGTRVLHVKGAPEVVLARCESLPRGGEVAPLTAEIRARILGELEGLQARAMRTIAVAYRPDAPSGSDLAETAQSLVWLGFFAIADPVRPEVPAAVVACRKAGIEVKIVTGDTPLTAREIGRQIGLLTAPAGALVADGAELTGPEFAAMSDADAAVAARKLQILARARPLDKLRLVRLLQDQREVVAVTGDGTNDAPALNHAKVGLAMGLSGTAAAREAADVVLLDDSFQSIVTAVKWGRGLYENIQRFIVFQLTINVAALGIALLGPVFGVELPLTVLQMLWVNLIMDTFAALALATEPPSRAVLDRPPRSPDEFIVTPVMARFIFGVGGLFLAVLLGLLLMLPKVDVKAGESGAMAPEQLRGLTIFFSVFVLLQFWNLFNARVFNTKRSALVGLARSPAFLVIAALILLGQIALVQFGGAVFRTVPLSLGDWLAMILATSVVLWGGELVRGLRRWRWAKAA